MGERNGGKHVEKIRKLLDMKWKNMDCKTVKRRCHFCVAQER